MTVLLTSLFSSRTAFPEHSVEKCDNISEGMSLLPCWVSFAWSEVVMHIFWAVGGNWSNPTMTLGARAKTLTGVS